MNENVDDLADDECWRLLRQAAVGRVAVAGRSGEAPAVHPVNYEVHSRTIAFRTASAVVVTAVTDGRPIAFEVDVVDPHRRTGWSVLVRGTAAVEGLDDEAPGSPWAGGQPGELVVRLVPSLVTGRRVAPAGAGDETRPGYL